jgi:uncharacterized protein (TIRG00374 family)
MALSKKQKDRLKFFIFFGLGLLLLWLSTKGIDFKNLLQYFKRVNYLPLAGVLLIGIASHLARALRWQMMITPLGKKPGLGNTFMAVMIGYLVNLATPRMGEVAKCAVLTKYEGIPADKLAGTMIAERTVDMLCLLLVAILTTIFEAQYLNEKIWVPIWTKLSNLSPASVGLALAGIAVAIAGLIFLLKSLSKKPIGQKITNILKGFWTGFTSIRNIKNRWGFIGYSLMVWLCYYLMVQVGFLAFEDTTHLGVGAGLTLLTLGTLGFIVAPGGIGAYQLIIKEALMNLYAIGEEPALAFGWMSWGIQTIILIILGFLSVLLLPVFNKTKGNEQAAADSE